MCLDDLSNYETKLKNILVNIVVCRNMGNKEKINDLDLRRKELEETIKAIKLFMKNN